MSRYINANELKELYEGCEDLNVKCAVVLQNIDDMPTADVVEVVRCKDCTDLQGCKYGPYLGLDGYCSRGEKVE